MKFLKRSKSKNMLIPSEEESTATSLSYHEQQKVNALKPKIELSAVLVDRNKWSLVTIILSGTVLFCALGWYHASERFANHVRVAFVKLEPSGEHTVAFYDENSQPTILINTVNSLLAQYVERRFNKLTYSIKEDYGFVTTFMSTPVKNDFLNNYHAAKMAVDFETCKTCIQSKMTVRTIVHDENDQVIVNGKPGTVYRTTVFALENSYNPDGTTLTKTNQIITLLWRLKDMASLSNNIDVIKANPLGIEILSESIKADPTPVTDTKI